ncbi:response regulator [Clostridium chromiireducens]|uniref:Stage 0 sporulation protein A homolog n=1 Tax=Clostridium chromiireducens TaxID=225345 RepID=A0A964RLX8_9CLOT|nr:response regulator [Clostridium chromiireducens]MVX63950.1 response regulator [Clostridium chromiireducens]
MDEILKVIIVDDEYLIRNLIKMKIDWKEASMEAVGEAGNAEQALELVDKLNPDIIFTDICMPSMDGIEFSKRVLAKYPHIKIIIVTGYDDFEYARSSVRLGISDFILKPINSAELMQTLSKLRSIISSERNHEKEYNQLKKQVEENLPKIKAYSENINGLMEKSNDVKVNTFIEDVKKYLNNNIANQNLSLSSVAKEFFISPGHLGRLFKQQTSKTFVEYLTYIRIRKVQKFLLETDLNGTQISERVGISDSHYLSILFKKQTGLCINEFKKYNKTKI